MSNVTKHFFMKNLLSTFVLLSLVLNLSAQKSIDLFSVSGSYGLPSEYEAPITGKATESQYNVSLTVPIVLSEKTVIYNNVNYYNFNVNNNQAYSDYLSGLNQGAIANPIGLHGFIIRTGLVQKIDDNNGFQLLFVPRYMSDFNESEKTAFQFGGVAMYEHRYSKTLMMRYGALYNQEFFGHYLVPVVHVEWEIMPKLSFIGMLPVYFKLKYQHSEKFEYGFSFLGLTTSFRLGDEDYNGDYMVRQSIDLALYNRYHIGKNIHIESKLGYSLGRKYEQYADGDQVDFAIPLATFGDDRTVKNHPFSSGAFVNVKLVYNMPLDDK